MSKSPGKNNRNNYNHSEIMLFKKWSSAIALADDKTSAILDTLSKHIKRCLGDRIYRMALSDSRLSVCDGDIYDHYEQLIYAYKTIIRIHDENALVFADHHLQNIYEGLYSILASRAKMFDESLTQQKAQYGVGEEEEFNPIVEEKKGIIIECLKLFGKDFDAACYRFKADRQRNYIAEIRTAFLQHAEYTAFLDVISGIFEDMRERCFLSLYQSYTDTVKKGVVNLNDLEKRRQAAYYIDMINQEHQILGAMIQVQAGALEAGIARGGENELIFRTVNAILMELRQTYQYLSREISHICSIFHRPKTNETAAVTFETPEEFSAEIKTSIKNEAILPLEEYEQLREKFVEQFDVFQQSVEKEVAEILKGEIPRYNVVKDYYDFRKLFSTEEILADEMIAVFKGIDRFMTVHAVSEESDTLSAIEPENVQIFSGIHETVKIKIESLIENKEDFFGGTDKFISELCADRQEISEAEIQQQAKDTVQAIIAELMELGKDDRRGIIVIKRNLQNVLNSPVLAAYEEKLAKIKAQRLETVNMKIVKFNKESLLFEMTTFEEIINYSVSRLRQSENATVQEFVTYIDGQVLVLEAILKKNGIEVIKPIPHDLFNAKEHEVLVAETGEGFKKGEIIKLMNCGYKQRETVIIRANVIACR